MRRCWWLLVLMMLPAIARAQTGTPAPAPAFASAGAFFALSVADLDASTKWYTEKLGMKVVMRARLENMAINVVEGGGLIVELIDHEGAVPLHSVAPATVGNGNLVHGITKVGVIVEDWDGLLVTLKERGVEIAMGPFPKRPEQRANLIVKDNSGNLIQFFGR